MKAFETELKVRFGDVDPAGIVYFPKIYDYIHEAFEELWDEHVGAGYYYLLLERRIGFPLVHSEVDFHRPLHFGDRPLVKVTCTRLGNASIGLRYRFYVRGESCLTADMTVVCVELPAMKSLRVPDVYRARFEAIMEEA